MPRPAVGSGGPGHATSTTGQSGAENTFALSVARLVESLPLSTPPGRRAQPGKLNAAAAQGISDFLLFGFIKSVGLEIVNRCPAEAVLRPWRSIRGRFSQSSGE